jgi:(p)ppGpp synthase/HD superfamily hydrolase
MVHFDSMQEETALRATPHHEEIASLSRELFDDIAACNFPEADAARIERAFNMAMRLHAREPVRSDGPYTHHILRVTRRVVRMQKTPDADCIVAALLHDAQEDYSDELTEILSAGNEKQFGSILRFNELFGGKAARMVYWLTDRKDQPGTKSEKYRAYVFDLLKKGGRAYIIKIADFLDNASNINDKPIELRKRLAQKWEFIPDVLISLLANVDDVKNDFTDEMRDRVITEILDAKAEMEKAVAN